MDPSPRDRGHGWARADSECVGVTVALDDSEALAFGRGGPERATTGALGRGMGWPHQPHPCQWVRLGQGLIRTRSPSVGARISVTQGPHNSRRSGLKASRTVDRPRTVAVAHAGGGCRRIGMCGARGGRGGQARRVTRRVPVNGQWSDERGTAVRLSPSKSVLCATGLGPPGAA